MRFLTLLFISMYIFGGCTSTEKLEKGHFDRSPDITEINVALDLIDHLRKVSGLTIMYNGSDYAIFMRGLSSINGENNVLFAVNGIPVGHRYIDLTNSVDVHDVKDIRLLRGTMGSQLYGMRGSNGVVEITTKK